MPAPLNVELFRWGLRPSAANSFQINGIEIGFQILLEACNIFIFIISNKESDTIAKGTHEYNQRNIKLSPPSRGYLFDAVNDRSVESLVDISCTGSKKEQR